MSVLARFALGVRVLLALAVLALGLVCLGAAWWSDAKQSVQQILLERAWTRARAGAAETRPWPWADFHPVAKLTVLGGAEQLIVLEGNARHLEFGPSHQLGTVLPGESGNSIIVGDRDTHFRFLRELRTGDRLRVDLADGRSEYFQVANWRIVDRRHWRMPSHVEATRLTLVTDYPFDALMPGGPLRFVVTADWIAGAGNVPAATAARAAGPPPRIAGG